MKPQRILAGDLDMFVQEHGDGPPLLLLSGLGYASWCWEETQAALPRFRTVALDNRGAGRSAKPPGPYTIDMLATDAARAIDELALGSVFVVGNSMGGYIALTLAARFPEKVRALVLANTSFGGPRAVPVPPATARAWADAAPLGPRGFAEKTMGLSFEPGWQEANPERFSMLLEKRLEYPTPSESWKAQLDACVAFSGAGIDAKKIAQPALVVHGTEDRIVPYDNGVMLAGELPNGTLHTIQGGGHLPMLADPAGFARLAEKFFT